MPHMVIFRDAEGRPGYHQAEAIDDAVRFVEQLRNEQDVTETRIFSMQEVPIEFRTYYRVALAAPPAPSEEPVGDEVVGDGAPEHQPEPVEQGYGYEPEPGAEVATVGAPLPAAEPPHSNGGGRFGLFSR